MRLLALAVLALSGCSLIRTTMPPPVDTWAARSDCRDSFAPPIVDGLTAAAAGAGGIGLGTVAVARSTDANSTVGSGIGLIGAGVAIAGLFLASAIVGVNRVGACHDGLVAWDTAHPGDRPAAVAEATERQWLRCPADQLTRRNLDFARGDPRRDSHPWAEEAVFGCGRVTWCGEENDHRRCSSPADFDFAAAQLSVESGCPVTSILQEQVFDANTQVSYRLSACGRPYSCIVPMVAVSDKSVWTGREQEHDRAAGSVFGSQLTCKPVDVP